MLETLIRTRDVRGLAALQTRVHAALDAARGASPFSASSPASSSAESPMSTPRAQRARSERVVAAALGVEDLHAACTRAGGTLMHLAAQFGCAEAVKLLIACGVDTMAVDLEGYQPLHVAARLGHVDVVQELVRGSPGCVGAGACETLGNTALHIACAMGNVEVARALIDSGVAVNVCNQLDQTPLHVASARGDATLVRLLIERGADLGATDVCEFAPTHDAATAPSAIALKILLDGECDDAPRAPVDSTASHGIQPIHLAAGFSGPCTRALLDRDADPSATCAGSSVPLHLACIEGNVAAVRELAPRCNLNARDDNGATPLDLACLHCRRSVVAELKQRGAMLDSQWREEGITPLHFASRVGNIAYVRTLIHEQRLDVNARTRDNELTPLHVACLFGHSDCTRELVAAGADLSACDAEGCTTLHAAATNDSPECVQILIDAVQSSPLRAGVSSLANFLDRADQLGETALHVSCKEGNLECMQLLVRSGASTSQRNRAGHSPMQLAMQMGHVELVCALHRLSMARVRGRAS